MLGLVAAGIGNLAGIAGGIFIVPFLLLLGFPASETIGSVQAALILPTVIASWDGLRRKEVHVKFALIFEISTVLGTWVGAFFTKFIPTVMMKLLFSMLAFAFSVLVFRQGRGGNSFQHPQDGKKDERDDSLVQESSMRNAFFHHVKVLNTKIKPHFSLTTNGTRALVSIPLMIMFGFSIGFLAGMLGIAGGWLKTPLMILVYEFSPHSATATALFMALITVTGGALAHWFFGHVNYTMSIPLTLGLTLGSMLAIKIKHRVSSTTLPHFIALILGLVGMILILSSVMSP